ncbi:MAG: translation initiation factor eIF-1A [Candidatus Altiarchaeota archaeon]|nr:translation initiation factor eIF-1A [Candidatus Altiarchaeota archaeon]
MPEELKFETGEEIGEDGQPIVRVRLPKKRELLGEVEQLLGDRRMNVKCSDGHVRLCRIPGKIRKRIWIKEGNIVLIEPWEVQSKERGDILLRYTIQQADVLRKNGHLEGIDSL